MEKKSLEHEVKEDIHKYVLHFPCPHQSMLDTTGKRQNTLVPLNIVRGRGGDNDTVWTPKCSNTFFPKIVANTVSDLMSYLSESMLRFNLVREIVSTLDFRFGPYN